jgi:hypothetical protein
MLVTGVTYGYPHKVQPGIYCGLVCGYKPRLLTHGLIRAIFF